MTWSSPALRHCGAVVHTSSHHRAEGSPALERAARRTFTCVFSAGVMTLAMPTLAGCRCEFSSNLKPLLVVVAALHVAASRDRLAVAPTTEASR
ncbi:MAG: hypothetical protein DI536_26585 [Archangium gephyra]|uniref:Uncharacterized protein n=1 Tax=Archangium gephyra TaxID=48 RepID=A0A2W5SWH6_9BACT|nr:MAG: hypothetical protein DI536_26585 [Archangium gephyra]